MEEHQPTSFIVRIARVILVCVECAVAAWAVGTAAYFLGGFFRIGLNLSDLQIAAFFGGIVGALVGLPVGLLIYYGVFHSRATWKHWTILMGIALATVTMIFPLLGLKTLLITPLVTVVAAFILRSRIPRSKLL